MATAAVSTSAAQFTQVVDKVGAFPSISGESRRCGVSPLGSRVEFVGASHSCSGVLPARIQIGTASRRQVVASAVASEQVVKSADASAQKTEKAKYWFVVANAKFMLDEEEHFQEQLKERIRHFEETGREQDFWLVHEPAFLDSMPEVSKRLGRPAVALVSTDEKWMVFMKLRLDRVLFGDFQAASAEEALASSAPIPGEFEKPSKWDAPYSKYASGWWKPFLPPNASQN